MDAASFRPILRAMTAVAFRAIAILEALTWVGLLVGMLFKYVLTGDTIGVRIFGALHGAAFVAYVPITLLAARRFGWSLPVTAAGLAAAFPPLGTLAFDLWVSRTGRLTDRAAAA